MPDLATDLDLAIDPPLLTVDGGMSPWRPPIDLATPLDPHTPFDRTSDLANAPFEQHGQPNTATVAQFELVM